MTDFKPCPFCGTHPYTFQARRGPAASCDECGVTLLATHWNARPGINDCPEVKALVAALRECNDDMMLIAERIGHGQLDRAIETTLFGRESRDSALRNMRDLK